MAGWNVPDTKFVILHDQDSADCKELKQKLRRIVEQTGKEAVIRIVCRELESWYFGDLRAVSLAYNENLEPLPQKEKSIEFRMKSEIRKRS